LKIKNPNSKFILKEASLTPIKFNPEEMIEFIGGFKKGVENVVHNGYDYGRPIFLGNQV